MQDINVYQLRIVKERSLKYDVGERKMSSPDVIAELLDEVFEMRSLPEEIMTLTCLDTKNKIVGMYVVSHGSINASIVHPREIFKRAMLVNANSIIIAHNHPSGDVTPSSEDIEVTSRIEDAGKLLGIKLLDHLIIGENDYLSFKARNLM